MENKKSNYYDFAIEFDKILIENGMVDDMFYYKDLQQRKLFITEDIDQSTVFDAVKHIMQINREDADIPAEERKPILLYLVSNGGYIDPGLELIDAITTSVTPVYTINLGYWYSMGFLIGIAGYKRFAMPNAKFLLHDGTNLIYNSGSKARDQMEFNRKLEERLKRYVINHTQISEEEYDGNLRVEWFMFADEAKNKGVIDYIIGEDISIDEIV